MLSVLIVSSLLLSAPPESINLQGKLSVDGTYEMKISLYLSKEATKPVVTYSQKVIVKDGVFQLQLAPKTPGALTQVFHSNNAVWVGLKLGDEPELPRTALQSVPWALVAADIQCTGCIDKSALPKTVAYLDSINVFTAEQSFTGGANFKSQQLRFMRLHNAEEDPQVCTDTVTGLTYFNSTSNEVRICDGKTWKTITSSSAPAAPVAKLSMNLLSFMDNKIKNYKSNDNSFKPPTILERQQFFDAVKRFMQEDFKTANTMAQTVNYRVVEIVDTGQKNETLYGLIPNEANQDGRGYFFLRPIRSVVRPLFLTAPHPKKDYRTGLVGVEVFRGTGARSLAVAGTSRCANKTYSKCSGSTSICAGTSEPYRNSDMAHTITSFFQTYHLVSDAQFGSKSLHLQLHGMASGTTDPEFSISDGTSTDTTDLNHMANQFAVTLHAKTKAAGSTKKGNSCNSTTGINKLCGGWNTQGRHTNGVPFSNACTVNTVQSSGRFLHLEMSKNLRDPKSGSLSPLQVIETVNEIIPTL